MIEFALVLPVILLIVFFTIDAGRLVYTYNSVDSIARDGARTASLSTELTSDCLTLQRVIAAGQGFPIATDPHSIAGDAEPNANEGTATGPSTPAIGQGFVYIYPAVAPSPPGPTNCTGSPRPVSTVHDVEVQVEYGFQPLTPLLGNLLGNIVVRSISVQQLEPCPGSPC
ncbi:MAG: TadE/TadG family type IV pilus assembly protein [Candidatus Dormibacteria bacterium]